MQVNISNRNNVIAAYFGVFLGAVMTTGTVNTARAENLNAGFVLNKMNVDQRVSYIAGVVEGLAYARFLRDKPNDSSMNCVYDWYDTDYKKKWRKIKLWFARHPDKLVGVLLYALIRKECGE